MEEIRFEKGRTVLASDSIRGDYSLAHLVLLVHLGAGDFSSYDNTSILCHLSALAVLDFKFNKKPEICRHKNKPGVPGAVELLMASWAQGNCVHG